MRPRYIYISQRIIKLNKIKYFPNVILKKSDKSLFKKTEQNMHLKKRNWKNRNKYRVNSFFQKTLSNINIL